MIKIKAQFTIKIGHNYLFLTLSKIKKNKLRTHNNIMIFKRQFKHKFF